MTVTVEPGTPEDWRDTEPSDFSVLPGLRPARTLAALSRWIDEHNADKDPEALLWGRVGKIGEEFGEAIQQLVAFTGQNPRKGSTPDVGDLLGELLDTAVAALGAVEHLTGNAGLSIAMLEAKIHSVGDRAGVA